MAAATGLTGVTVRLWLTYQAKTGVDVVSWGWEKEGEGSGGGQSGGGREPEKEKGDKRLWPNLSGLVLAPTTAKRGALKKALRVSSVPTILSV